MTPDHTDLRRRTLLALSAVGVASLSGCSALDSESPSIAVASDLDETHLGTVENEDGAPSEVWISFSRLSVTWEDMSERVSQLYVNLEVDEIEETLFEHVESDDWARSDSHEFADSDELGGGLFEDTSISSDQYTVEEDGTEETFEVPLVLTVETRDDDSTMHEESFDLLIEFTVRNTPAAENGGNGDAEGGDAGNETSGEDNVSDDEVGDPPAEDEDTGDVGETDDPADEDTNESDGSIGPGEAGDDEGETGDDPSDEDDNQTQEDDGAGEDDNQTEEDDGSAPEDDELGENELDGPTVIEEPGEYTLVSDISAEGTCFEIEANGEVLIDGDGHHIGGDGSGVAFQSGYQHLEIRNVEVEGFESVVTMGGGTAGDDTLVLDGVSATDCAVVIQSVMSGRLDVQDSTFTGIRDAVYQLQDVYDGIQTEGTRIEDCGDVVDLDQSAPIDFIDCEIRNAGTIMMSSGVVENCVIEDSAGFELWLPGYPNGGGTCAFTDSALEGNELALDVRGSTLEMQNCELAENDMTLRVGNESEVEYQRGATLESNNFASSASLSFDAHEGPADATCNWWGHETGPDHPDNAVDDPQGATLEGEVEFEPWLDAPFDEGGACEGTVDAFVDPLIEIDGRLDGMVS